MNRHRKNTDYYISFSTRGCKPLITNGFAKRAVETIISRSATWAIYIRFIRATQHTVVMIVTPLAVMDLEKYAEDLKRCTNSVFFREVPHSTGIKHLWSIGSFVATVSSLKRYPMYKEFVEWFSTTTTPVITQGEHP